MTNTLGLGWSIRIVGVLGSLLCGGVATAQNTPTVDLWIQGSPPSSVTVGSPVSITYAPTVSNYPSDTYACTVQGPTWAWEITSVQLNGEAAPSSSYSASLTSGNPPSDIATLTITYNQPGNWSITVQTTATFTDSPCTDTWIGTGSLTITEAATAPVPVVSLSADNSAVCAGGINSPIHQATLTASVTDDQGIPMANVGVVFTTTDGALSSSSGTTDSNGQVTTVLTSSQNATDEDGQWLATVQVSLSSEPDIVATASVEFQPPTLTLAAGSTLLSNGDTTNLTLVVTWNGTAVQGHSVGWRISRVWDVNEQLIYDDTGSPPSGYVSLIGQPPATSPTDVSGQAVQVMQAGPSQGRVEVAAQDTSVLGAGEKKNPEKRAAAAVNKDVVLESYVFDGNNGVLKKNKTRKSATFPMADMDLLLKAGDDVPYDPKGLDALVPITWLGGKDQKVKLDLNLNVSNNIPANSNCTITGDSAENALKFSAMAMISPGDNTISVTATNALGESPLIRKINNPITWKITVGTQEIALGVTGPHVIYTTLGDPDINGTDGSTILTVPRMDLVVSQVGAAITAANSTTNYAAIVWKMNQANATNNYFNLNRGLCSLAGTWSGSPSVEPWLLPSLSTPAVAMAYDNSNKPGADCISNVVFTNNVCKCAGVKGDFSMVKYIAYYQTADNPNRPTIAVEGSYNDTPVKPGDDSVRAYPVNPIRL